jgi:hypothetical protein
MSWKEPESIWAKTQRNRATVAGTVFALALLLTIAAPVYHLSSFTSWNLLLWRLGGPLGTLVVLVIPFIVFASLSVVAWKQWRKERWILNAVPRYDGRVCPGCRKALHKLPPEGKCNRCGTAYESSLLQEYWERYTLDAPSASSILHRMRNRGIDEVEDNEKRTGQWLGRLDRRTKGIIFFACFTFICLLAILILQKDPLVRAMTFVLGGMIGAGYLFLLLGTPHRVARARHCPGCGYQLAPQGGDSERCPECGVSWSGPGGALFGRLVQRPAFVVVGYALIGSVLALWLYLGTFYSGAFPQSSLSGLYPTSYLVARIADADDRVVDVEWTELSQRRLSADQEHQVAKGLLDRRLMERLVWLKPDPDTWFSDRIEVESLPQDIVDRYYREGAILRVRGPQIASAGDDITLRLTPSCQQFGIMQFDCPDHVLFFAGYRIGTSSKLKGRLDHPVPVSQSLVGANSPEIHFTAGQPGILEIFLQGWHVVGSPEKLNGPIIWREDGTPVIPSAAVWSERFEIKHVMRIKP